MNQKHGGDGSLEVVVLPSAWLFAAISVPLTLCIIFVWWMWTRFQTIQNRHQTSGAELSPLQRVFTPRRLLAAKLSKTRQDPGVVADNLEDDSQFMSPLCCVELGGERSVELRNP